MSRVLVLGGSGMLGSMIVDWLARDPSLEVGATVRDQRYLEHRRALLPEVQWCLLDAEDNSSAKALSVLEGCDWIINAIGVIKPFIHEDNPLEVERAIRVNALFPHCLARRAREAGARVLQIATDCVYSGREGRYNEDAPHDPMDVYGKTKSLGEARSDSVFHLRCSIIGPEPKNHLSLLDWFLRQPSGAKVTGFTNHRWNGVTTLHFARICQGIIKTDLKLPYLHHVIPGGEITKAGMLEEFAGKYGREDIEITHSEAANVIDRTLSSRNEILNRSIWEAAGFHQPPGIPDMIAEMRSFDFRLASLEGPI